MKSEEEKLLDYIEAVKLKLKAHIISTKAEKLASDSPFNAHGKVIKALEDFGIESGLLTEEEVKKDREIEEEKKKARKNDKVHA